MNDGNEILDKLDLDLDEIFAHVRLPDSDYSAFLTGSIVDAFGNERSDVDIVVVIESNEETVESFPDLLYLNGRRVEIRFYRLAELLALADRVSQCLESGADPALDDLDLYHRVIIGQPLTGSRQVHWLQSSFDREVLQKVLEARHLTAAVRLLNAASVDRILDLLPSAALKAREAAACLLDAAMTREGETYLSGKWIFEKIRRRRSGERSKLMRFARYLLLTHPSSWRRVDDYLEECFKLARHVGLVVSSLKFENLGVEPRADVMLFKAGASWYLITADREAFRLNESASVIWQFLAQAGVVDRALWHLRSYYDLPDNDLKKPVIQFISRLQQLGLARIVLGQVEGRCDETTVYAPSD